MNQIEYLHNKPAMLHNFGDNNKTVWVELSSDGGPIEHRRVSILAIDSVGSLLVINNVAIHCHAAGTWKTYTVYGAGQ